MAGGLYTDTVHVLSRVAGIHPLVWPPTRDVGRCTSWLLAYFSAVTEYTFGAHCAWDPDFETATITIIFCIREDIKKVWDQ
jgi:hypothetical protein